MLSLVPLWNQNKVEKDLYGYGCMFYLSACSLFALACFDLEILFNSVCNYDPNKLKKTMMWTACFLLLHSTNQQDFAL